MKSLQEALEKRQKMEKGEIWASDILAGKIYLGAGRDAQNLEKIIEHQITHIINCADDIPNYHETDERFLYLSLQVTDFGGDTGIGRVFGTASEFIKQAFEDKSESVVLLHCANGSNRSATIAVAILMVLKGDCR